MVALAVETFGKRPVVCNARPLLFQAHAALERGSHIEAGCKLREAIRVWLLAECVYCGCRIPLAKKGRELPPLLLAKALKKAGEVGQDHFEWIVEAIDVSNQAAHVVFVRPSVIACCIDVTLSFLDSSPYLVAPKGGGRI